MKNQFRKKAYSTTIQSRVSDVPKPVNLLFQAIINARASTEHRTKAEVFCDIVMREAELVLGKEEADRVMQVFEKQEKAQEQIFLRKQSQNTPE